MVDSDLNPILDVQLQTPFGPGRIRIFRGGGLLTVPALPDLHKSYHRNDQLQWYRIAGYGDPSVSLRQVLRDELSGGYVWWPLFQSDSPLEEIRALFFDRVDRALNQALLDWCESQRPAVQECYGL